MILIVNQAKNGLCVQSAIYGSMMTVAHHLHPPEQYVIFACNLKLFFSKHINHI